MRNGDSRLGLKRGRGKRKVKARDVRTQASMNPYSSIVENVGLSRFGADACDMIVGHESVP